MDAHRGIVPLQCDLFSSRERAREGGGWGATPVATAVKLSCHPQLPWGPSVTIAANTQTPHTHTHTHTIRTHKHTYSVTADMMCLLEASRNKL